jgi:hypothetical protein
MINFFTIMHQDFNPVKANKTEDERKMQASSKVRSGIWSSHAILAEGCRHQPTGRRGFGG